MKRQMRIQDVTTFDKRVKEAVQRGAGVDPEQAITACSAEELAADPIGDILAASRRLRDYQKQEAEQIAGHFAGMPVIVDDSLGPNEVRLTVGRGVFDAMRRQANQNN